MIILSNGTVNLGVELIGGTVDQRTLQVIDGLLQLCHRSLCKLSSGLCLKQQSNFQQKAALFRHQLFGDSHLFQFISQNFDLFLVLVLLLRVLRQTDQR